MDGFLPFANTSLTNSQKNNYTFTAWACTRLQWSQARTRGKLSLRCQGRSCEWQRRRLPSSHSCRHCRSGGSPARGHSRPRRGRRGPYAMGAKADRGSSRPSCATRVGCAMGAPSNEVGGLGRHIGARNFLPGHIHTLILATGVVPSAGSRVIYAPGPNLPARTWSMKSRNPGVGRPTPGFLVPTQYKLLYYGLAVTELEIIAHGNAERVFWQ